MTGPWLPRFRIGGSSNETIDGRGVEGRYVQFDWLGFILSIEVGSTYANERFLADIRAEREGKE
jgi:hypothetical protein